MLRPRRSQAQRPAPRRRRSSQRTPGSGWSPRMTQPREPGEWHSVASWLAYSVPAGKGLAVGVQPSSLAASVPNTKRWSSAPRQGVGGGPGQAGWQWRRSQRRRGPGAAKAGAFAGQQSTYESSAKARGAGARTCHAPEERLHALGVARRPHALGQRVVQDKGEAPLLHAGGEHRAGRWSGRVGRLRRQRMQWQRAATQGAAARAPARGSARVARCRSRHPPWHSRCGVRRLPGCREAVVRTRPAASPAARQHRLPLAAWPLPTTPPAAAAAPEALVKVDQPPVDFRAAGQGQQRRLAPVGGERRRMSPPQPRPAPPVAARTLRRPPRAAARRG